ncbi:hypothetical protein CLG85_007725 [Yangia mangrovi]|uniref:Uncharacterized protein n=1 Tax=Alloyangia mangrovi TaxID=1779329 RepID=A0ABT2KIN0_9RHOB|nr:hypothetical protein [Alloyangia mangrovi]
MVCISFVSHGNYLRSLGGAVIHRPLFVHEQMSGQRPVSLGKTALQEVHADDIMTS